MNTGIVGRNCSLFTNHKRIIRFAQGSPCLSLCIVLIDHELCVTVCRKGYLAARSSLPVIELPDIDGRIPCPRRIVAVAGNDDRALFFQKPVPEEMNIGLKVGNGQQPGPGDVRVTA